MARARVLVVDDKESMLSLLERVLGETYEVTTAADGTRAMALVASTPFDVVLTDIRMPGADGFEVLKAVKSRSPRTEVVLMTGYAAVQDAVSAMKQGAFDYLTKPFDPDAALLVVSQAADRKRLQDTAALRSDPDAAGFHNLVGRSGAMRDAFALLDRAATLDITVLLTGATGTGKELAARAIHYHSGRKERRFVAVNCGALPAELVESELFGHARGSFTGATTDKPGLFREATGGTLFLDEIGELPLATQVKLNRALQEKEVRRVGDSTSVRIDVRVVAATHRDLVAEVSAGRFREDLYYRLNVFPIRLPALRERREDIPLLAAHFLEKHARAFRREVDGFDPQALVALAGHSWPGNVRQLENAVERAVAVSRARTIALEDLPPEIRAAHDVSIPSAVLATLPYREAVDLARDRVSREYLVTLLRELDGNVTRAAGRAGMERESLHRLMKKYGIRSDDFKPRGS